MAFELRTKWYRVAVEGDSVDGREISKDEITELAQTYSTEYYTANIYNEHVREWGCYGQVVALKAETVNKPDVPAIHGKTALFAVLSPNQFLISLNKLNQKIFTSIEIWPNFQNTGKVYMAGFAVTDQPAATGTEALKFNSKAGSKITDPVDNGFDEYLKDFGPVKDTFHAQIPVKPKQEEDEMKTEQFEQFMQQQKDNNDALLEAVKAYSAKPAPVADEEEPAPEKSKEFAALTESVTNLTKIVEAQSEQFKAIQANPFGVTDVDGGGEEGFEVC